jgi:hypothetical protein
VLKPSRWASRIVARSETLPFDFDAMKAAIRERPRGNGEPV